MFIKKFQSHLLARRGLAERIGNLLGQLKFSDDQLERTENGLKDAGVPMPNFGNIGRELAEKINEEPEVEVETEEEREPILSISFSTPTTSGWKNSSCLLCSWCFFRTRAALAKA